MEGRILSQVHNFREVWQDPTAHAEVVAIREATTRLSTWRLTSRPCTSPSSPAPCVLEPSSVSRDTPGLRARDPKAGACGSVFNLPANAG